MFSTDLSTIVAILALVVALITLVWSIFAHRRARIAYQHGLAAYAQAPARLERAEVAQIQAQIADLGDSYEHILKAVKRLSGRQATRRQREKAAAEPDPKQIADKSELRQYARDRGLIK